MNDFTEEELKRIRQQLLEDRQWVEDLVNPDPLIEKLESMIDNYCDHECKKVRDINCIKACPKCGKHHHE